MTEYTMTDLDSGCDEVVEADDMEEACEACEAWIQAGDWDEDGCRVSCCVKDESTGEQEWFDVDVEPDHAYLIARTGAVGCGDRPEDHEWDATVEIDGGLGANPGVFSRGSTMIYKTHCSRCGLRRKERVTGMESNPDDSDTTEYWRDD